MCILQCQDYAKCKLLINAKIITITTSAERTNTRSEGTNMIRKKIIAMVVTFTLVIASITSLTGCSVIEEKDTAYDKVLRVGMECAYPPFNWTQDTATTPDGSQAVKIYNSDCKIPAFLS